MSMLEKILAKHEGIKTISVGAPNPVKEEKKEEHEISVGKLNYDNEEDLDTAEM